MLINGATMNLMFTPENQEDILELGKLSQRMKATMIMKRPPLQNEIEAVMIDYRQVGDHLLGKKTYCKLKESVDQNNAAVPTNHQIDGTVERTL